MKQKLRLFMSMLLMAVCMGNAWAVDYVKVTSTSDITDGQYLIVYEGDDKHESVAFDGSLETLDAVENTKSVTIEDKTIKADNLEGSEFTIDITNGTLKSASGFYIGVSSNSNGLNQEEDAETYKNSFTIDDNENVVIAAVFQESTMTLRYNYATNQLRFRYYKNNGQQAICLYKKSGSTSSAVATTTKIDYSGITNTNLFVGTEAGSLSATVKVGEDELEGATVSWSSSDTEVATINENGVVTLVGAGTTTITASYAGVEDEYQASSDTYTLTVTYSDGSSIDADWVASEQGYENSELVESDEIDENITVTFNKGTSSNAPAYYTTGKAVRIYGGGNFTISGGEDVTITSIALTFATGEGINEITSNPGTYENNTWTGSANSVTFSVGGTSGHRRLAGVSVTYTVESSSAVATTTTIDYSGITNTNLFVGTEAGSLSATVKVGEDELEGATVSWSSSDTEVATINENGVVTLVGAGTTTITASYAGVEDEYKPSSATYDLTVTNNDPNAPGTENNPYTVAQARNAIEDGTGVTGVYAKGIVSEIVTAYNSQYGNISYNISDDGSTTSNQLQAFRGKSYNGDNFTSEDDIQVGDEVVIYGNLKKYNDTYEFDAGNQLVKLVRKAKPTITINPSELDLEDATTAEITVSPTGLTVSSYTSSDETVATVADGVVTAVGAGTATITVSWAAQTIDGTEYEAGSKEITVKVVDPNAPGTENNPYKVSQARDAIDAGTGITGVYATGIVSKIVTAFNSQNGYISYNISADGSEEGDQLQAYKGKSYNGDSFTSEDDIQVGDEVVIYGNLKKYNSIYEFDANNQLVKLVRKAKPTITISSTELNLADENAKTATITVSPDDMEVTYASNDEEVATVAEGIVTAVGTGTATITVSWEEQTINDDVYQAGNKTFEITVIDNAPEKCVFEEDYYTRFDFTKNGWGLPTTKAVDEGEFTNYGKTIKLAGTSGNGYRYFDQGKYVINGKKGAYLTLPAFNFDVMAIEVKGKSGASDAVKQNIFVGDTEVSTETVGAQGTNLYFIKEENQSAGNIYTIKVTSAHNTQFTEIKVYKKDAFVELNVSDAGYRTYCDIEALDFNVASPGLKSYIVEGVDAEGSTNLVLKEVGKVPTETGVLIEAEEGTYYVAKLSPETEEGATVYDDVSTNKLIGVIAPTEVDPSIIVLMNGEKGVGFYKTSKTFTVGANTAYLPLSTLEAVASTEGDGVKLMNLYGNDDDTPTGITVISASELSGKESVIYNLSGQRVSRAVKGLYIVNGKKVMVK